MKLRNKKTGEIVDDVQYRNYSFDDGFGLRTSEKDYKYKTLAKFIEEWEDYKPTEPLIKDEKIRKAVRAWAEANGVGVVLYKEDNYRFYADDTEAGSMIEFEDMPEYIGLRHEHRYTIAELCGEEEE